MSERSRNWYEREARREAFRVVPETCPALDEAEQRAIEAIDAALPDGVTIDSDGIIGKLVAIAKAQGTERLRDAWIDTLSEKLAVESDLEDEQRARRGATLHDRVVELEREVARLERQIERMEDEAAE